MQRGSRPKKSLGQNFLVSKGAVGKIVDAVSPQTGELIFEIGPGRGALTVPLGKSGARVVAYEIDETLASELGGALAGDGNVEVICADIRDVDLDHEASARNRTRYKLVGNLPYHLTGTILTALPRWRRCAGAVLMVQREVGDRITAAPGQRKGGILTVYLQSYFAITRVARLRPGSFRPSPKVESAVLKFVPHHSPAFPMEEERYLKFLKLCFSHRRKKLKHVFRDSLGIKDASALMRIVERVGVDLEKRPEELELDDWFKLYRDSREFERRA